MYRKRYSRALLRSSNNDSVVRYWHLADIHRLRPNVRFEGKADIALTCQNARYSHKADIGPDHHLGRVCAFHHAPSR